MESMPVPRAVARWLTDANAGVLFGLMGDANVLYIAEYERLTGTRFVNSVHEAGAVSMADGFARATGRLGWVSVTHGPAVTNTLTALTEAVRARTPLVLLTGDTPAAMRDHLQSLDLASFASLAGAGYERCRRALDAQASIARAARRAAMERRPILLDLPADIMAESIEFTPLARTWVEAAHRSLPALESAEFDRAMGYIASAERPVVLAGRGAALADAYRELVALVDALGAAAGTTLLGKGFFRGHPADIGIVGGLGDDVSTQVVAASDCVVSFGAGLNHYTTAERTLFRDRNVVQVDADPSRLGRFHPPTVGLLGDARATAELMVQSLAQLDHQPRTGWRARVAELVAARKPAERVSDERSEGFVDMKEAMRAIDALLPEDRVVVTDSGRFMYAPWRLLSVQHPLDFMHTIHFGSIGLGLGTAIGAALARPNRVTVLVAGDGGAMMSLNELHTAVRLGLRLIVVILNDGCFGAEYKKLNDLGLDPRPSLLSWPEFAGLGVAFGAVGLTVRSLADLGELSKLVADETFPIVVDVKCDPATVTID